MSCRIAVRVTPRSAKPGIGDWRRGPDGREELELRVAEAPTDGSANAAVIRLLAAALRIPKSRLSIISGLASRHKGILVPLDLGEAKQRLGGGKE